MLHLFDGSAYFFRAFYGLPPLSRADGLPTGAVYGFCQMLWKISRDPDATHRAVVMDAGRSGRDKLYPDYKGQRKERPPELTAQLPYLDRACAAFGLARVSVPGYEADDVIATLAHRANAVGLPTVVYSSDKDLMQIVGGSVSMMDPIKGHPIGVAEVIAKWGVPPRLIPDLLALTGDVSDNIPGVLGVGPKSAAKLLQAHDSLDAVLTACARGHAATTGRLANLIRERPDRVRLSHRLATVIRDVPDAPPIGGLDRRPIDYRVLLDFLDEMEFSTLAEEVTIAASEPCST